MNRPVLPLYVHPAVRPDAWAELERRPEDFRCVVVNVSDGPGEGLPDDEAYVVAIRRLHEAGLTVAGYVDLAYGARTVEAVRRDVLRWRTSYGVTSTFLDRFPPEPHPRTRTCLLWLRNLGVHLVVANPGVHPDPAALDGVDVCVTFENTWAAYQDARVPCWAREAGPSRVAHLVHDVPAEAFDRACALADLRGASCLVTDATGANPWVSVPPSSPTLVGQP